MKGTETREEYAIPVMFLSRRRANTARCIRFSSSPGVCTFRPGLNLRPMDPDHFVPETNLFTVLHILSLSSRQPSLTIRSCKRPAERTQSCIDDTRERIPFGVDVGKRVVRRAVLRIAKANSPGELPLKIK